MTKRNASVGGLVLAAVLATGCAARQKASAEPSGGESLPSTPADEQHDVDTLETLLLDQESVIVRDLLPLATTDGVEGESATSMSDTPGAEGPSPTPTACRNACKALASMGRAVEGICRLTEDEPERCERARKRVARASDRVTGAGCVCSESD